MVYFCISYYDLYRIRGKTNMADRENLIGQLAAAMGAGNYESTKFTPSRYDRATGTLYCNGHIISASTIEKAKEYFEHMMKRCDVSEPAGREMCSIYELSLEAIKFMESGLSDKKTP